MGYLCIYTIGYIFARVVVKGYMFNNLHMQISKAEPVFCGLKSNPNMKKIHNSIPIGT